MDANTPLDQDRGLRIGQKRIAQWVAANMNGAVDITCLKRRYHGGVFRIRNHERSVVCKTGDKDFDPECEAAMLRDLASAGLSTPDVIDVEPGLLVLDYLCGQPLDQQVITDAGKALASMHRTAKATKAGYGRKTAFGVISLENGWSNSWTDFFIDQRISRFADHARHHNRLPKEIDDDLSACCARIRDLLPDDLPIALLHGDIWDNNVLNCQGKPVFLDPSAFYGDPGYEVAFLLKYLSFRQHALEGYRTVVEVHPDFWRVHFPIYALAINLAHLALFGTPFLVAVTQSLDRVKSI